MRKVRKAKVTEAQAIIDLHADTIRKINSKDYSQAQVEMWIGTRNIEITQSMIENGEYCVCVDHTGKLLGQGHSKENEILACMFPPIIRARGSVPPFLSIWKKRPGKQASRSSIANPRLQP